MIEVSILEKKNINLSNRIDAEYYEKKLFDKESRLKIKGDSLGNLFEEETKKFKDIIKKEVTFNYLEISSININNGTYVTEDIEWKNAPSRAQKIGYKDQIAISTVRPYRSSVALIAEDCVCTSGLVIFKSKKNVTTKELFVYFKSKLFIDQITRRTRATMYPAVDNSDFKELIIPKINKDLKDRIEIDIEEKLKIELSLIKCEKEIEEVCLKFINNYFKKIKIDDYQKTSISVLNKKDLLSKETNRLDSEYYQNFHNEMELLFKKNDNYEILSNIFDYIDTGSTPAKKYQTENNQSDYFILKASCLTNFGLNWSKIENVTKDYFNLHPSKKISINDILILSAAHSPEQIGKKISQISDIDKDYTNTISVGELITLKNTNLKSDYSNFVLNYLRSRYGYIQIQRLIRGITSHLYPQDVKKIKIPKPNNDVIKKISEITKKINNLRNKRDKLISTLIENYNNQTL
jgi:hypothetical protein